MGMLAALGRERVPVTRCPRVAILATGDELVPIDAPLGPGKIRNANGYSNAGQVLACGGMPIRLGIARDTTEELTAGIHRAMKQGADLLITSGGVSVGDFDLVKQVLAAEGDMGFWRVRMKPGKPLAFGTLHPMAASGNASIPILGLPGNPVSAMVSFEMFARPAIMTMLGAKGWQRPMVRATLMDSIPHKDERRHYVRVTLRLRNEVFQAHLTGEQGSGILSSMVKANALAIIPEDWSEAPAGARVDVMILG
jgi:molybdopterin molybdotransferase